MNQIIIAPVTETQRFHGMKILARGGSIAALVGDTFEARTRSAFDSEASFLYSVGYGQADLYTFNTLVEAARFANRKIEALMALERSIDTELAAGTRSLKIHTYCSLESRTAEDGEGNYVSRLT
jgi:hypothetical protein